MPNISQKKSTLSWDRANIFVGFHEQNLLGQACLEIWEQKHILCMREKLSERNGTMDDI